MDTALKARWVAALRSGRYAQGDGFLLHNDRYCCLGVLCEIEGEPIEEDDQEMPSDGFLRRVGLSISRAMYYAEMNDANVPFAAIANKIESRD